MGKVCVVDHPLVQHKLSMMRDKNTSSKDFRELLEEIAGLMAYEVTRDLKLEDIEIETPVATAVAKTLSGRQICLVPILRAGLGMVNGVQKLVPAAKVGHIGLYRDPDTLGSVEYYAKLPEDVTERSTIVLDPMMATGGSACTAISYLKSVGCTSIRMLALLAVPTAIERLNREHPDVDLFVAAIDPCLNDHGYIVPGLGDAGDRIFGTR
nr:uracil phosphoribosyltransferase [bacterium]